MNFHAKSLNSKSSLEFIIPLVSQHIRTAMML